MSFLLGAAESLNQVWVGQDPKRESLGCRPFYEAQEPRGPQGQNDPQGPTLAYANRTYF